MSITPGTWKWWTSNSWTRLMSDLQGRTASVLMPCKLRDGQVHIIVTPDDMAVIAAAPAMLAKLEEVRASCCECLGVGDTCSDCADIREVIDQARKVER